MTQISSTPLLIKELEILKVIFEFSYLSHLLFTFISYSNERFSAEIPNIAPNDDPTSIKDEIIIYPILIYWSLEETNVEKKYLVTIPPKNNPRQ